MRLLKFFLFLCLFFVFKAGPVFSHGFGQSFFKQSGEFVLELEYEALEVRDGEVVPYRFQLLEKDASGSGKQRPKKLIDNNVGDFVAFDDAFIRFNRSQTGELVYAVRISQDQFVDGLARFSAPLDEGDYQIKMVFYKNEHKLAEAVFDHKVLPREKTVWDYWQHIVISVLFLVVIYLLYLLFRKTKNKK